MLKRVSKIAGAMVLGLALMTSFGAQADDVQALIDKYVEATGGEEAHKAIKNRTQKGVFSIIDMGMSADMETYSAPPNFLNVVSVEGMGEVRNGISGDTVWEMHFMNGDSILDGGRANDVRQQAALNPWEDWKKWYSSAKVVGEDDLDGEATVKVEFSKDEGDPTTIFFSKDSGLIVGQESVDPSSGMAALQKISEYKEVDGVKLPHKIAIEGMMNIEISILETKHNQDIPSGTFDVPEAIAALK